MKQHAQGFTVVELFATLAIVFVLVLVLMRPAGGPSRHKPQMIKCVNNLKNLSLAVRIFSEDNKGTPGTSLFQGKTSQDAADYFRALSNELAQTSILVCPSDLQTRPASNFASLSSSNLSYFLNRMFKPEAPGSFLFGDRNLATNGVPVSRGAVVRLTPDLALSWTSEIHGSMGNIALGDGSVQNFRSKRLPQAVQNAAQEGGELLFP